MEWSWKSIILSFGIGFGLFTIFNYVLILLNVYYPIVNWLQLVALGVLVRYQRNTLRAIGTHINLSIRSLYTKNRTGYEWILVALLLFQLYNTNHKKWNCYFNFFDELYKNKTKKSLIMTIIIKLFY